MSSRRPGRRAAAMLAALVLSPVIDAALAPLPVPSPAAAATRAAPALLLEAQTQWVEPAATGPATFELTLKAPGASPTDRLTAVVYHRLHNRSTFERVEKAGPQNVDRYLAGTEPVPLSSLPAGTRDPAAVRLSIAVVTHPSGATPPGPELDLQCATGAGIAGTGTCPGVYPVEVTLRQPGGAPAGQLTTFLTFTSGKSAHRLELAWVVPIAAPVHVDTGSRSPRHAIAPVPRSEVSHLSALASQLRTHPAVPVTLEPSPQTLQALRSKTSGPTGKRAVHDVALMSANPSVDEIPPQPYVPVDLQTLAGAGEPTEIVAQMAAGATTLRSLGVTTAPTGGGTWVASSGGAALLTGLAQVKATRLVVPATALVPDATVTSETPASLFRLEGKGTTPVTTLVVAEADGHLTSELGASHADPALAASWFLADLAMVHFEEPNLATARGLVAVPPPNWRPNTTFDSVLLQGLDANPDVAPVTLDRFFSSVTLPTRSSSSLGEGTRRLRQTVGKPPAAGAPALKPATAAALSRARLRLSAFDGATSSSDPPPIATELTNLLLSSEHAGASNATVAAGVSLFERALSAQLGRIAFAVERTVTLTARTGIIPVTVVSHLHYPVTGVLTVKSGRFLFPGSGAHRSVSHRMVLDHATNSWKVDVIARSSGEMPLYLTFTSPTHPPGTSPLVFATGQLSVRSTATSVVGIVLTVLALIVLLGWWARTWWAGRRRRQARPAQ